MPRACIRKCLSSVITALLFFSSSTAISEGKYLFEILESNAYLNSWNNLISSKADVDSWLRDYAKTKNGPATPAEKIVVGEKTYEVYMVCKAHDCGSNQFHAVFLKNGNAAYGLLLKEERRDIFGNPDADVLKALKQSAGIL